MVTYVADTHLQLLREYRSAVLASNQARHTVLVSQKTLEELLSSGAFITSDTLREYLQLVKDARTLDIEEKNAAQRLRRGIRK